MNDWTARLHGTCIANKATQRCDFASGHVLYTCLLLHHLLFSRLPFFLSQFAYTVFLRELILVGSRSCSMGLDGCERCCCAEFAIAIIFTIALALTAPTSLTISSSASAIAADPRARRRGSWCLRGRLRRRLRGRLRGRRCLGRWCWR